ncbi:MAG: tRNA uridine-5-carboxymethylaminomethyl(34) synthesis enzyme MnmG, partial [Lachnospiraceae bacterium]|nr:tRNA uridine-5-carboxymethylaminomethyl(34) synthesis enzyme MnmG [Lachnospiraceae bacterium]
MKFSVSSAWENKDGYDVVVIGAGHAGCEAALASARLGLRTIIFTVSVDSIAMMPCNPNIGGTSKGHLVREIDALGGEMGKNIDKTFIQSKMLNMSKGPAVHSLRAQADKNSYSNTMRQVLENTPNLEVRQMEIAKILWEDINSISLNIENQNNNSNVADNSTTIDDKINSVSDYSTITDIDSKNINKKKITGVMSVSGTIYPCRAVILCTGTYLNGRCLYGDIIEHTGPNGLKAANYLTDSLNEMGIKTRRFKTGTPARVDSRSLDFSKMEEQKGDEYITPFSFATDRKSIQKDQISCWLTYTNDETHTVIRDNINRSPLFTGVIEGTGPRYCPSIEDKVVKFPDKIRHQLFVEPEGLHTNEMYLAGMSSSLPEDVQYALYRTIPGLENCRIVRNAYAIEYDCIDGRSLKPTLEFNDVDGLFSAGQFNGSSGYEEAAAQGLIAGINAARKLNGDSSIIIDRSMGYIGVLIDDIVTKESHEPYRMMTSRAEYRLLLRQDNADQRLTPLGYEIGLISKDRYDRLLYKEDLIANEIKRLEKV